MNNANTTPAETTIEFSNVAVYLKGGFGNVIRVDCKTVTITTGVKFAQYRDAIELRYVQKGKRKQRGTVLTYRPLLVVLPIANAVTPRDLFGTPTTCPVTGLQSSESRFAAFDDRFGSEFAALVGDRETLFAVGLND